MTAPTKLATVLTLGTFAILAFFAGLLVSAVITGVGEGR